MKDSFKSNGTKLKTIEKSKVWNEKNIKAIPKDKPKSPILFTIIAFIAALFACIRVCQKLINKYDASPTPSQPKNNCT